MKIDNYLLERLRAEAAHTMRLAECEDAVQHCGLRGRLREILVTNLLAPWLPPFCRCATGMIVESRNKPRKSTQEDILVIDPTLAPPILAQASGPEGIFPFNSILLRIEVKSTINANSYAAFIDASAEIAKMQFDKLPKCTKKFTKPYSILVAFNSDSSSDEWDSEFHRFCQVMKERNSPTSLSGFVSAICVVNKGLWFLKGFGEGERSWCRLDSDVVEDRLVYLIANVSNTAYRDHVERQGRDPSEGLEVGIGNCIPHATIFQMPQCDANGGSCDM